MYVLSALAAPEMVHFGKGEGAKGVQESLPQRSERIGTGWSKNGPVRLAYFVYVPCCITVPNLAHWNLPSASCLLEYFDVPISLTLIYRLIIAVNLRARRSGCHLCNMDGFDLCCD